MAFGNRFRIDQECRISINLLDIKRTGTPVSVVSADLKRWMNAYLAYCRRLIGPDVMDRICNEAMKGETEQQV